MRNLADLFLPALQTRDRDDLPPWGKKFAREVHDVSGARNFATHGEDHDMVLTTRLSLGVAKAQTGDSTKAMQIFLGCLRSLDKRFGPLSPDGVETFG